MAPSSVAVAEPFPVFRVADNFLLYDINTVTHIRRQYSICGVLLGSLPQVPQQNVFLGLPVQLMPDSSWLCVKSGVFLLFGQCRELLSLRVRQREKRLFTMEDRRVRSPTVIGSDHRSRSQIDFRGLRGPRFAVKWEVQELPIRRPLFVFGRLPCIDKPDRVPRPMHIPTRAGGPCKSSLGRAEHIL